jgi:hypothetical protein
VTTKWEERRNELFGFVSVAADGGGVSGLILRLRDEGEGIALDDASSRDICTS